MLPNFVNLRPNSMFLTNFLKCLVFKIFCYLHSQLIVSDWNTQRHTFSWYGCRKLKFFSWAVHGCGGTGSLWGHYTSLIACFTFIGCRRTIRISCNRREDGIEYRLIRCLKGELQQPTENSTNKRGLIRIHRTVSIG